ncbi:unnamed protein product [Parascedosporium putredinis]|uniref:Peptidase M24 C-terminal domain-containing protein n=1 Tax=Parascedosporium putredinis TaxID=1442378 RepID=A0A9P1GWX2_9PEZI|nr:unnamed protein product [Parascedosporium putredinis]CAI7988529.1 unnamed protein product [Parascedosporium putredinis]
MSSPCDSPPDRLSSKFHVSTKASWALKLALGGEDHVEEIRSPITDAKAIKNPTEMNGMRACHIRDGVALIRFFAWLENELVHERAEIDEVDAATRLEELRREQDNYVGLSFSTISSTGAKNLLDIALLTESEKRWLNNYNDEILGKMKELVKGDLRALAWLERQTRPV